MRTPPVIYLCSFYRTGRNRSSIHTTSIGFIGKIKNVLRARKVARELWLEGCAVICPVSNNGLFDYGNAVSEERIAAGLSAIVRRSDALFVMERDWRRSCGIILEINEAYTCHIPVFFNRLPLSLWIEAWQEAEDETSV